MKNQIQQQPQQQQQPQIQDPARKLCNPICEERQIKKAISEGSRKTVVLNNSKISMLFTNGKWLNVKVSAAI